ncbi:MAG: polysaccharide deacetylase family protein [Pseudomonadota bacterium]
MTFQLTQGAKQLAKRVINPFFEYSGANKRQLNRLRENGCWIIITYHRVIADLSMDPYNLEMCVSKDNFYQHIKFINDTFRIIPMSAGIQKIRDQEPITEPLVSINFDDGYLDFLEIALPILQEFNVPSTIYIATGNLINHNELYWWDRVVYAIANTNTHTLNLSELELASLDGQLCLRPSNRGNSLRYLLSELWKQTKADCFAAINKLECSLGATAPTSWAPRMNLDEIKKVHKAGVEIGGHSIDHHDLTLLSAQELKRELMEPKSFFEDQLNTQITGFAYPSGKMSDSVKKAVRDANYEYAASSCRAFNSHESDPFELQRMMVGNSDLLDLKRCMSDMAAQWSN